MSLLLKSTVGCSWSKMNNFIRSLASFRPHYNYGLPGKGKSSPHILTNPVPKIQGEVLFGHHPIVLALKARKRKVFHCVYMDNKFRTRENKNSAMEQIFDLTSNLNIPVQHSAKHVLDQLAGNRPHQGVCMDVEMLEVPMWSNQGSLASLPRTSSVPLWLLLHNVQDPMNFGAILRTAHYLGVDQVVLPSSDSCRLSPVVSKASAGALEIINLTKLSDADTEIDFCKWWQSQGGIVVGTGAEINGSDRTVVLENFAATCPTLIILGNEGSGLGKELEDCCDKIVTIPGQELTQSTERMQSLNVSVAAGILLHWMKTSSISR